MHQPSSFQRQPKLFRPTWIATVASLGVHGVVGFALPTVPSDQETDLVGDVNLLELTPEEQQRLPSVATTPITQQPLTPLDLLSVLPPQIAPVPTPSPLPTTPPNLSLPARLPNLGLPSVPNIPAIPELPELPITPLNTQVSPLASAISALPPLPPPLADWPNYRPPALQLPPEMLQPTSANAPLLEIPPEILQQNSGNSTARLQLPSEMLQSPREKNPSFDRLPQLEAYVLDPSEFPEQPQQGPQSVPNTLAQNPQNLGPLPRKIPQSAIAQLRELQAQKRQQLARNLQSAQPSVASEAATTEVTPPPETTSEPLVAEETPATTAAVAEKIPDAAIARLRELQAQKRQQVASNQPVTTPESTPTPEWSSSPITPSTSEEPGSVTVTETPAASTLLPDKVPDEAIARLRELQAQKRQELARNLSNIQRENLPAASDSSTTVAASTPEVEQSPPIAAEAIATDTTVIASDLQVPDAAIAQLRKLQKQLAYNSENTDRAAILANLQTWLGKTRQTSGNPELVWQPIEVDANYPDLACRTQLQRQAGDATIGVLVDPDGKIVAEPDLLKSTGYLLLNEKALDLVKNYQFESPGKYEAYLLEIRFSGVSDNCAETASTEPYANSQG